MTIRNLARNAAVALALSAAYASSLSAATSRSLLGSWVGEIDGDSINIIVWFDEDGLSSGIVRGFVVNNDKRCGSAIAGNRVLSAATIFFRTIADDRYTEFALEFELRNADLGDYSRCALAGPNGRFLLGYDDEVGSASLAAMGNPPSLDANGYTVIETVTQLRRGAPSAETQRLLARNPAIDREQGRGMPPSASVAALIADPTLDPETLITTAELPCQVQVRDQQVRMRRMGIASLAGSQEAADRIGVRYDQYAGPIPEGLWPNAFRATRSEQYVQLDTAALAEPNFLEMPGAGSFRLGPDACRQAIAVDAFLARLESGQVGVESVAEPQPRMADANGLYFFNEAGIDEIIGERMRRVYASTTVFRPGDLTRTSRFNPESQTIRTRAMVKHSLTGVVEEDFLSLPNDARFFYDPDLSETYGGDIWTTGPETRDGDCQKWAAQHFIDNCIERAAPTDYGLHRYYLASDLDVAKRLFAVISPDAQTEFSDVPLDPARGCDDGPFCGLPGGLYLDAVFRGDFDLIEALEVEIMAAQGVAFEALGVRIGGDSEFFRFVGRTVGNFAAIFDFSPLPQFANTYMYQYQEQPSVCFEPGAMTIPKEEFVPASVQPGYFNLNGSYTEAEVYSEAYIARAAYTLNPEFFELCDSLCDTSHPSSDRFFVLEAQRRLTQGFERVLSDFACDSPAVQQFETNLIDVTFATLRRGPLPPDPGFVERSSL